MDAYIRHHLYDVLVFSYLTGVTKTDEARVKPSLDSLATLTVTGVPDNMPPPPLFPKKPALPTPTPRPTVPIQEPNLQLAFEMATIEYGYKPSMDDPMVTRFAHDLYILQSPCRQTQQQVADETTKAWEIDQQHGGNADLISLADALVTVMTGAGGKAGISCPESLAFIVAENTAPR